MKTSANVLSNIKLENKFIFFIKNIIMWCIALTLLMPLFWMLSASFKRDNIEVFSFPIKWIPENPTLDSYYFLFKPNPVVNISQSFMNSILVVLIISVASFFTCVFAAYAFSRMEFVGRDVIFIFVIISMAVPPELLIVPHFVTYSMMGVVDTLAVLCIGPIFANAFGTFLIRQTFLGIPKSIIESAKMDGASHLTTLFRIIVPLAKETIITFLLLQFTWVWNNYMGPLLWIKSSDKYTIPLAIKILQELSDAGTPVIMAGSVLSIVPIILIFITFQKYFEKSVISAGVKG
ncbi:MAG: carbohydrate ABC transporter permease [Firmicutes bacterium]|nr:carbohydrate ABC transporter permease [Bacillota bacterium]